MPFVSATIGPLRICQPYVYVSPISPFEHVVPVVSSS